MSGDSNGRFHSCILEWLVQFLTVLPAACLPRQQCTLPWSNIRPRWSAPPSWLRRSSGLAIGVQPSCRLHWLRSGLFARSRLGLPNTTGVGFLGGSSWWQLFPLRFWPCGRSTRSCWIRRLTEVRRTQGSFSYGGDDCAVRSLLSMFSLVRPAPCRTSRCRKQWKYRSLGVARPNDSFVHYCRFMPLKQWGSTT